MTYFKKGEKVIVTGDYGGHIGEVVDVKDGIATVDITQCQYNANSGEGIMRGDHPYRISKI